MRRKFSFGTYFIIKWIVRVPARIWVGVCVCVFVMYMCVDGIVACRFRNMDTLELHTHTQHSTNSAQWEWECSLTIWKWTVSLFQRRNTEEKPHTHQMHATETRILVMYVRLFSSLTAINSCKTCLCQSQTLICTYHSSNRNSHHCKCRSVVFSCIMVAATFVCSLN